MIKSFLILINLQILLFASQQIIFVVADDFNASRAKLECIEDSRILFSTDVNLGTNGLGWGIGERKLTVRSNEPFKKEGDKKAPAGIFKLTDIFGYEKKSNYKLPYLYTSKELICVDDSNSNFYNQIIEMNGDEKSFEYMKRRDNQYKYGVSVAHNQLGEAERGSCIFLHVEKKLNHSTAGCTSMREEDMKFIINWLNKDKNPLLIQITEKSVEEVLRLYPQLKNSKLVK